MTLSPAEWRIPAPPQTPAALSITRKSPPKCSPTKTTLSPTSLATSGSAISSPARTGATFGSTKASPLRSEEHTSELQSRLHLVCRLLLEKKKKKKQL